MGRWLFPLLLPFSPTHQLPSLTRHGLEHVGEGGKKQKVFSRNGYCSRLAPYSLTWHMCKTDPLLCGHLVGPSGVPWPAPHLLSLALLPLSLRMPGVHTVHTLPDGDPLPSRRQECSQLGGFSLSCGPPTSLAPTRTRVQEGPHPAPSSYPQQEPESVTVGSLSHSGTPFPGTAVFPLPG